MLILLVSSLKKFQEFFFEKIFNFIMIGDSADQHISFSDQKPLYIKLGEVHRNTMQFVGLNRFTHGANVIS